MCVCVYSEHQKGVSEALELELQAVLNHPLWFLRTSQFSETAGNALKH